MHILVMFLGASALMWLGIFTIGGFIIVGVRAMGRFLLKLFGKDDK